MRPKAYYVATQDNFGGCSVHYGPKREAAFIGVAAPGMLHALSFLLDQRRVSKVLGVNTNADHAAHFADGYKAWQQSASPREAIKAWLGWNLPSPQAGQGCHLDDEMLAFIFPDANEISFSSEAITEGELPRIAFDWLGRSAPSQACLGWRYGWLDEVAFDNKPSCAADWYEDDLNEALLPAVEACAGQDVVIYLSNLLSGGAPVEKLCRVIKLLAEAQNVYIWVDDNTVKTQEHATKYFGKHSPYLLLREHRPSPHAVTNHLLGELRRPGSLLEVHPHGTLTKRWQFVNYKTMGTEEFVKEPVEAETICLHVTSCYHNGNYLTNRDWLRQVVDAAEKSCQRLLILEHNPYTRDHLTGPMHNCGTPVPFWRELLGRKEDELHWCRGITDMRRNYYAVYDKEIAG